jgi:hypothetical protein
MFTKSMWAVAALSLSAYGMSEPIGDAAQALCEKVKACSMAQIAEEDMTDEMRQMMEPMLENMCANMGAGVEDVPTGHALYKPALACMEEMAAMSCDEMDNMGDAEPAACAEYQRLAKEAYTE